MADTQMSLTDIFRSEIDRLARKAELKAGGASEKAAEDMLPAPDIPPDPLEVVIPTDKYIPPDATPELLGHPCVECGQFAFVRADVRCYWCKGGRSYVGQVVMDEETEEPDPFQLEPPF